MNMLTPLLKSRVNLEDAIQDTTYFQVNSDNSIDLVYRDTVVNFLLAEYINVPDTSVYAQVKLETISLSTGEISQRQTIADIMRQMGLGGFVGFPTFIIPIPAQCGLASDKVPIDASAYFEEADLSKGEMTITIDNQLPTDLDSVVFELTNDSDLSLVTRDTIFNIPQGTSKSKLIDLAGKHVESAMNGQLINMCMSGVASGAPLDTVNQYIDLKITLDSLQAYYAKAIFPEQRVIDNPNNVKYYFGQDVQITKMGIRSGTLVVDAESTIENPLEFIYTLPTARKYGEAVTVTTLLPKAPPGGSVTFTENFDLAGYTVDLTVNGDSVNLFPQHLIGNLKYTGELVEIDTADFVDVYYGLESIVPDYIEGYIGRDTFRFTEAIAFDVFNSIQSGSIDLANPKVSLTFLNSIGVDGELTINQARAKNTRKSTSVDLSSSELDGAVNIIGPRLPNVGQTVGTTIKLDKNNSNVRDFLNVMPDTISFDLDVIANKNGVPWVHDNFAFYDSKIQALLDVEVPLHGIADMLALSDTLDLDMAEVNISDQIQQGEMKLFLENTFPMEAAVQIYFLDVDGDVIDSLFTDAPGVVPAGTMDGDGVVDTPGKIELNSFFTNSRFFSFKNHVKKAIAKFTLSTKPNGTHVKLYTTYGIDFKLVGDFNTMVRK